jgi:simple sugar transport system ATP-binding protein
MSAYEPMLIAEDVSKSYGSVLALDDISFQLNRNSILGLVGDNGAGKSTLLKIINGFTQADSGRLVFDGERVAFANPQEARQAGVAMTYEDFALVDDTTVWENFFMGREMADSYGPIKTVRSEDMRAEVESKLTEYGFDFGVDKKASELSGGQRRILVVSRAIESDPKLLLLDEPFRGLSERAINQLWDILHDFTERGSVIITSQWYSSVEENIDDVLIFRQGRKVGEFANDAVDSKRCNRLIMEGEV